MSINADGWSIFEEYTSQRINAISRRRMGGMKTYPEFLLVCTVASLLSVAQTDEDACDARSSCSGIEGLEPAEYFEMIGSNMSAFLRDRNCFCDPLCHLFGQCCSDKTAPPKSRDTSFGYSVEHILHSANYYPFIKHGSPKLSIIKIARCPNTSSRTLRDLCYNKTDDMFKRIPVSGKQSGLVFRNIFCAVCHGAGIPGGNEEVILWQTPWKIPEGVPWPPFRKQIVESCIPGWRGSDVKEHCLNYTSFAYKLYPGSPWEPQMVQQTIYKNKHCAQCNYVNDTDCLDVETINQGQSDLFNFYNMKYLVDFTQDITEQPKCAINEFYDPYGHKCRPAYCLEPLTMTANGECLCSHNVTFDVEMCMAFHGNNQSVYFNLTCPVTYINTTYEVLHNDSIYFKSLNLTVSKEDYFKINDTTTVICVDSFHREMSSVKRSFIFPDSLVESSITITGYSISLISMIFFIVVHLHYSQLRNLPGKLILSLVFVLFFAQLMFLLLPVVQDIPWLCQTCAIVTHYLYLSSFFWMNVISFDIWKKFDQHCKYFRLWGNDFMTYIVYLIYAMLSPLVLIFFVAITDYGLLIVSNKFKADYGHSYCWITNTFASLCYFALPVAMILLSNIFLFTLTICNICATSTTVSGTSTSFGLSLHAYCMICIKLSFIMGFTWVFGFLSNAVPDFPVLWFLFILLGSFQGLFISIAFMCNRKVYMLIMGNSTLQLSVNQSKRNEVTSITFNE